MIESILPFGMTVVIFAGAVWLYKRSGWFVLNPVLLSDLALILILLLSPLSYDWYKPVLKPISTLLSLAVVILAVPLFNCRETLSKYFLPIIMGVLAGIATCFASVFALAKLFGLDQTVIKSLLPKSITTPMAIEASTMLQGITSLTTISVIITGILGGALGAKILAWAKISDHTAKGIGIGASSHGLGTAQAFEISETAAAASGAAMALTGILTVIIISVGTSFL